MSLASCGIAGSSGQMRTEIRPSSDVAESGADGGSAGSGHGAGCRSANQVTATCRSSPEPGDAIR